MEVKRVEEWKRVAAKEDWPLSILGVKEEKLLLLARGRVHNENVVTRHPLGSAGPPLSAFDSPRSSLHAQQGSHINAKHTFHSRCWSREKKSQESRRSRSNWPLAATAASRLC